MGAWPLAIRAVATGHIQGPSGRQDSFQVSAACFHRHTNRPYLLTATAMDFEHACTQSVQQAWVMHVNTICPFFLKSREYDIYLLFTIPSMSLLEETRHLARASPIIIFFFLSRQSVYIFSVEENLALMQATSQEREPM